MRITCNTVLPATRRSSGRGAGGGAGEGATDPDSNSGPGWAGHEQARARCFLQLPGMRPTSTHAVFSRRFDRALVVSTSGVRALRRFVASDEFSKI